MIFPLNYLSNLILLNPLHALNTLIGRRLSEPAIFSSIQHKNVHRNSFCWCFTKAICDPSCTSRFMVVSVEFLSVLCQIL